MTAPVTDLSIKFANEIIDLALLIVHGVAQGMDFWNS